PATSTSTTSQRNSPCGWLPLDVCLRAAREHRVMLPPATPTALLFGYAFLSNIALAVVPHEPAIIWYGPRLGLWTTTLVATAGTLLAAIVDHRVFVPLIRRVAERRGQRATDAAWPERLFRRFPFATIALSGLTPLPFFPLK